MRKPKPRSESSLLHLVEEATELLRRAEVRAWVWWLGGTAPFVCVLLHFWTDMSRAADAAEKLPGAALMLALCYWWMKVAHCVFGDHLLRQLRGDTNPTPLTLRQKLRFVAAQALIHFSTPWVLILSVLAMLPLGWTYAFYHNVTILSLGQFREGSRTGDVVRLALRQTNYRVAQNHAFMIVLLVVAVMVWMNWWSGLLQISSITRSLTGSDNFITRNPMSQVSSTVFAATIAAAYLVAGPMVKAIYAIRCFYGMSRKNGEDILVTFRNASSQALGLVLLAAVLLGTPTSTQAQTTAPIAAESPQRLDSTKLDKSIQEVLQEDAFQWRMPRSTLKSKPESNSWLNGFFKAMGKWFEDTKKALGDGLREQLKKFFKTMLGDEDDSSASASKATPWADVAQIVLRVLLVILALVLAILLVRQWRKHPPVPVAAAAAPEVNLESDQVIATQLPENEWLKLAQQKIEAGDFRLAMRALFLATLAHLGERRLLAIARSKSNGDYVRELGRRARDRQDLRGHFVESVRAFDRSWYGWHEVSRDQLDQFRNNHQLIIADAAPR